MSKLRLNLFKSKPNQSPLKCLNKILNYSEHSIFWNTFIQSLKVRYSKKATQIDESPIISKAVFAQYLVDSKKWYFHQIFQLLNLSNYQMASAESFESTRLIRPQNFTKYPPYIWPLLHMANKQWIFWPFQNIWTLDMYEQISKRLWVSLAQLSCTEEPHM